MGGPRLHEGLRLHGGPRLRRGESGAAAVEAALCLCFVVIPLVFGIISYAYMFSFRQTLSQATAEGARAAVGVSTATDQLAAVQQAVTADLQTYGVTCNAADELVRDGATVGSCTITPPNSTCTTGCQITVSLTYHYRANSMLPTVPGLGFTLPPDLSFTSVVQTS